MSDYGIETYGERWAPFYDSIYEEIDDATIDFLKGLAGRPPRALELAIGSGRIALPLAAAGVQVTGIDVSDEMVALLRAKPGGEAIKVVTGDFADVAVEGGFPLVYLAFNTLFALLEQGRQVECFQNVARALEPGGSFVLDTFVPDLARYDHLGTRMGVSSISSNDAHAYEMSIHDPIRQTVVTHHVRRLEDDTTVVLPVTVRYAWPSELDLMGRLAGLELVERWGWYDRRSYTERSGQYVSVYRKPR
jgi:SAM-dependent methyltransferase